MLRVVMYDGIPLWSLNRGAFLMRDDNGKLYWLNDSIYTESRYYIKTEYLKQGKSEEEATALAEKEAFDGWGEDMDGITPDENGED